MALNSPTIYPDSQACNLGVKHDTYGLPIPMSHPPKCTSCLLTSHLLSSPALVQGPVSVPVTAALLLASQFPSWLFPKLFSQQPKLPFVYLLDVPCSLWDLSSLTRIKHQPLAGKAQSPNYWTTREFQNHLSKA